jgi:hypothetical protein
MTDPRGIVSLKAGSKTFKLRLPINRICDMEADFSEERGVEMDCRMIGLSLENAGFRALRKVTFHALADDWNDKDGELDERRAGEIMEAAGMTESAKAVGDLWRVTFPQPVDQGVEDGEEDADQGDGEPTGNRAQRRAAKSAAGNAKPK